MLPGPGQFGQPTASEPPGATLSQPDPRGLAFETRHYAAGETLIREGDPPATMVFIRRGRAAITVEAAVSAPLTVAIAEAGVVVGELSFYTGAPCSATVSAIDPIEAELITRESLARIAKSAPDLAVLFQAFMLHLLADKLIAQTRQQAQEAP